MKLLFVSALMSAFFAAEFAMGAPQDALKNVPQNDLQGITILGCEEKPSSYTVNCRTGGKCTITVIGLKVSCKGKKS